MRYGTKNTHSNRHTSGPVSREASIGPEIVHWGVSRGRRLHGENMCRTFLALWRGARRLLAQWRDRARMRRLLAGMDERALRDIGLALLEARREINKPFWRR